MKDGAPIWVTYASLLIAFLAFVRPNLERWWRQRRAQLKVSLMDKVAVSYGPMGPMLQLKGTLRAHGNDIYIEALVLEVVRQSDSARHTFRATVEIPFSIGNSESPTEIIPALSVRRSVPLKFNYGFQDIAQYEAIDAINNDYLKKWYELTPELRPLQDDPAKNKQYQAKLEAFRKSKEHIHAFRDLNRTNYWEPGNYRVTLRWENEDGKVVELSEYGFELTKEDAERISWSVSEILEAPIKTFNGIETSYQEARTSISKV
jgi:hypothetical protein